MVKSVILEKFWVKGRTLTSVRKIVLRVEKGYFLILQMRIQKKIFDRKSKKFWIKSERFCWSRKWSGVLLDWAVIQWKSTDRLWENWNTFRTEIRILWPLNSLINHQIVYLSGPQWYQFVPRLYKLGKTTDQDLSAESFWLDFQAG